MARIYRPAGRGSNEAVDRGWCVVGGAGWMGRGGCGWCVLGGGSSFRDLEVWQESMTLVEEIYALTTTFPVAERFEVDVQMELAVRLRFCPRAEHDRIQQRVDRIGRMLNGLIESLQPRDE